MPCSGDRHVVTAAMDSMVILNDVVRCESVSTFTSHSNRVKAVDVAPNTPYLCWTAGEDGRVLQFDVRARDRKQHVVVADLRTNATPTKPWPLQQYRLHAFKHVAVNPVRLVALPTPFTWQSLAR